MKTFRPLPAFTWLAATAVLIALMGVIFGNVRGQQIAQEAEIIRADLKIENDAITQ